MGKLGILLLSYSSLAVVFEVGGEYGYSKKKYGETTQNTLVSKNYSGSLAMYFIYFTALEFNYSESEDLITENNRVEINSDVTLVSVQNKIDTDMVGVGIRQSLGPPNGFFVPVLSIGHAEVRRYGTTYYNIEIDGQISTIAKHQKVRRDSSVFASFMLKMRMTKNFYIKGSVKTVFKAFEFDQADNFLKYRFGLSWLF